MYKLVDTKDNSPSLILSASQDSVSEMMHNSHGAFKESLYIYESALIEAHQKQLPIEVYSLGLGLGYNEWISIGYCLKHNLSLSLQSSESEAWLVQSLKNTLGVEKSVEGHTDVEQAMGQVIHLVADHYGLSTQDLIFSGKKLFESQSWRLLQALSKDSLAELHPATVIFYDAFSKKMSPQLWEESFLKAFLEVLGSPKGCIFSTYACTGALKRALKQSGFELVHRPGFEGKRESTFATKF